MRVWILTVWVLLITVSVKSQTVYKTPSGAKYHTANCRTVRNVAASLDLKKAVASGLAACKVCKPPLAAAYGSVQKKVAGQGSSVQCRGQTKKGSRCQHMTRMGNGYCFQHQPG